MATKSKNYRELQAELDKVLIQLQSAELDIDEALKLFEQGQDLVGQLEDYLKTAKNKVEKIKSKFNA